VYNVGYYVATVLLLAAYIMVGRTSGRLRMMQRSQARAAAGDGSAPGARAATLEHALKCYTSECAAPIPSRRGFGGRGDGSSVGSVHSPLPRGRSLAASNGGSFKTDPSSADALTVPAADCKVTVGTALGLAVWATFWFCGVQLAFIWGFLTLCLHFVPWLGAPLALLLPVPFILLDKQLNSADAASQQQVALVAPVLAQLVCNAILEPWLLEYTAPTLSLHPVASLLSVVICWRAWSIVGAAVALPLLAALRVALDGIDHPVAELLSAALRPASPGRSPTAGGDGSAVSRSSMPATAAIWVAH
jgi:hypothetical protein